MVVVTSKAKCDIPVIFLLNTKTRKSPACSQKKSYSIGGLLVYLLAEDFLLEIENK
jgi:hypothetical protein